jgi:hypothetical protein
LSNAVAGGVFSEAVVVGADCGFTGAAICFSHLGHTLCAELPGAGVD